MTTNLPAAFQARYFKESQSAEQPTIVRDENNVLQIPVFVRAEQVEGETIYKFFVVPVRFTGQKYTDYETCVLQSYREIRKFFYGTPDQQFEMRDDSTWEGHRQAVRSAFPKLVGEINTAIVRWNEIKETFWSTIDSVLESVGKDRSVLPDYFNDTYMIDWAKQNNVPAEVQKKAEEVLVRVSLNLNANGRNWKELFL